MGMEQRVTVSLGVSSYMSEDTDAESVLKRADQGLYRAKGEGKNRVCLER